ncbi:MAG: DUF354 domain-containing protein [Verrucomicrobiales bacterium]|nr:DUF354 domain-containing protein [Verrucomicrobiales bacterium]
MTQRLINTPPDPVFNARLYYATKSCLPWRFRLAMRRLRARSLLQTCSDVWPIQESAGDRPEGWPGWPDGKQFALVLTHDVETAQGLRKIRPLLELEMQFGLRSSFNLIPEGSYTIPDGLRPELSQNGFEVGVHDLHHDGRLFRSRDRFRRLAPRINRHLSEWGAVGFRAGFMFHQLEWLHDLNIRYDASTFDTDPFEPQPDGVRTIFPFWVSPPARGSREEAPPGHDPQRARSHGGGYVELPYTLPQDFTALILLARENIDLWTRKLDWIATRGGMALIDTHPDYMRFPGDRNGPARYEAKHYADLLRYVTTRHAGRYWQALPREVAEYVSRHVAVPSLARSNPSAEAVLQSPTESPSPATVHATPAPKGSPNGNRPTTPGPNWPHIRPGSNGTHPGGRLIWIDLDNSPHVPFFEPIIRGLQGRGHEVMLTARDAFQVRDLVGHRRLNAHVVGRHYGRNPLLKVLGLGWRSVQLSPSALFRRPDLAVSHGARSQLFLCNLLGIPSVLIDDYEHSIYPALTRPNWCIVPESLPVEALKCHRDRVLLFTGLKEDVYTGDFEPDERMREQLGLRQDDLVVTVRPPASEAHYHDDRSEVLFAAVMDRLTATPEVRVVLLPRNDRQQAELQRRRPEWFATGRVTIPDGVVDGLALLWASDLVVSAGGTMNREAAALGVPVYSIFQGPTAAVDQRLEREGRLTLIRTTAEVNDRIVLGRRTRPASFRPEPSPALDQILAHLEHILDLQCNGAPRSRRRPVGANNQGTPTHPGTPPTDHQPVTAVAPIPPVAADVQSAQITKAPPPTLARHQPTTSQ